MGIFEAGFGVVVEGVDEGVEWFLELLVWEFVGECSLEYFACLFDPLFRIVDGCANTESCG